MKKLFNKKAHLIVSGVSPFLIFSILFLCSNKVKKIRNYYPPLKIRHVNKLEREYKSLEIKFKLGEKDAYGRLAPGKEFVLFKPKSLAITQDERIFVLDQGRNQVVVFNKKGKFLYTFGKKGQGPGEFVRPFDIGVSEDGQVFISDYGNRRMVVFGLDGKFLRVFKVKDTFQLFAIDEQYIYTAFPSRNSRIHIYSFDGKLLFDIGTLVSHKDYFIQMLLNMGHVWAKKHEIYFCYSYKYQVEKFEKFNGKGYKLTLKFSGKSPFGKSNWTSEEMYKFLRKTGNPPPPILSGITIDDRNIIYIWSYSRKEEEKITNIDLFSQSGDYLHSLKLPFKASPIRIYRGRLYAVSFEEGAVYKYFIQF
jgi:hypothetical protein